MKKLKPWLVPGLITGAVIFLAGVVVNAWCSLAVVFGLISSELAIGFCEHTAELSHAAAVNLATACGAWVIIVFFWKEEHFLWPFPVEAGLVKTPAPPSPYLMVRLLAKTSPYIEMAVWKLIPFMGLIAAITIYKHSKQALNKTVSIIVIVASNTLMIRYFGYLWKFVFGRYAHAANIIVIIAVVLGMIFFACKLRLKFRRLVK